MLFFRRLVQVDKIDAVYFGLFVIKKAGSIIFVLSSETALGSAGEQPH